MLCCAKATKFPVSIVIAAITATTIRHWSTAGKNPSANNRSTRAKAAALDPMARYAVTGKGAPS